MAISITNSTLVKSSSSSPIYTHNSLVPLTIFDKVSGNHYAFVILGFKPPVPSNDILKKAMSATLNHFPHLAGRLTVDSQSIILNDAGVRIIETYVPTTLEADFLSFDSFEQVNPNLFPHVKGIDELVTIQLNRYACGGLVFVGAVNQRVGDGQSFNSFIVAWSRLVRGVDIDPLPCHDRSTVFIPRKQPTVEFDHRSVEFCKKSTAATDTEGLIYPFRELVTYFSQDFIQEIKAKVMDENLMNPNQRSYSSFECLLAHLWKKVTQARGLELDEVSQLKVAVNGRRKLKPPLPDHYFGSVVLYAYPRLTVGELLTESYNYVASTIRMAVEKIDNKYFQSFVDFGELSQKMGEELVAGGLLRQTGNILCPDLLVISWLTFDYHQVDLGGGPPSFCRPKLPLEGALRFMPSTNKGGGINVVASLLPQHAQLFEKIRYSLEVPILSNFKPRAKF